MDNSDTLDQYFQQQELDEQQQYLIEVLRTAAQVLTVDEFSFLCMSCDVDMEDV